MITVYRYRLTDFRLPCNNEDIASEGRSRGKAEMRNIFKRRNVKVVAPIANVNDCVKVWAIYNTEAVSYGLEARYGWVSIAEYQAR